MNHFFNYPFNHNRLERNADTFMDVDSQMYEMENLNSHGAMHQAPVFMTSEAPGSSTASELPNSMTDIQQDNIIQAWESSMNLQGGQPGRPQLAATTQVKIFKLYFGPDGIRSTRKVAEKLNVPKSTVAKYIKLFKMEVPWDLIRNEDPDIYHMLRQ
jgi:hypothetical protein